ncbi:MAG TPA: hypothetical protein VK654_13070, partial [Nitrospirota bacterium]|nr:hypothetical protein [Nitrospirota bacterium]
DFFKGDGGLLDLTGDAEEASIRLRNADSVIGISMSYKGSSAPYMSLEPYLLAPLLTVFTEKTEWKGKRGFPLYKEGTAKVEKILHVTLFVEDDFSVSIELREQ